MASTAPIATQIYQQDSAGVVSIKAGEPVVTAPKPARPAKSKKDSIDRLGLIPGRLAQLGERRLDKAEVTGSSPVSPMSER